MTLLLLYLFLALGVSFLCSLLEAALLSVPVSHVMTLAHQGHRGAQRLQRMKISVDRPLAAILTLNTIAHTVGAAGVGAEAVHVFGDAWIGVVSAVVTLLILVLSEIIPKTLGAVHARNLTSFTAWSIEAMIVLCFPLVIASEWLAHRLGGGAASHRLSRDELFAVTRMAQEAGEISAEESDGIRNLLMLSSLRVKDIMTPRPVVFALDADRMVAEVAAAQPLPKFARIPVYRDDIDHIVGMVHRYNVLEAVQRGEGSKTLGDIARPLHVVPDNADVSSVFQQFIDRREQLFQVVDEYGGTAGIITLEDAFESMIGREIIDETDSVADMRQLAQQRLARRQPPRERARE